MNVKQLSKIIKTLNPNAEVRIIIPENPDELTNYWLNGIETISTDFEDEVLLSSSE
jgi:hypothetical protein